MKIFSLQLSLIFCCIYSANSLAKCSGLTNKIYKENGDPVEILTEIRSRGDSGELCVQNLAGRLYFEGVMFEKNIDLAHQIFFALANKGYPPAQFNLAFKLSEDPESSAVDVLNLLQGIFVSYVGNDEYGGLASKARTLGRGFVLKRTKAIQSCQADPGCTLKLETGDELEKYSDNFENILRKSNHDLAAKVVQDTQALRKATDTVAGLLSVGLAVGAVTSGSLSALAPKPTPQYPSVVDLIKWGVIK